MPAGRRGRGYWGVVGRPIELGGWRTSGTLNRMRDEPKPWRVHHPEFKADNVDPERATGPWAGHRDFAYDLMCWLQPETVVELGTHYGVSLFALVQAVEDFGLHATVHAVDTWLGDEYAGYYGDEVFDVFRSSLEFVGSRSVRLHRMRFEDALLNFGDESIDLLHIDGNHSYEALKEDFETWLPKIKPNGLVLLHDVSPESKYGSAAYYADEIAPRYPSFSFPHNYGLGVVAPGGTDDLEYLFSDEFRRWLGTYTLAAQGRVGERMVAAQAQMIVARDEAIAAQSVMIHERDGLISDYEAQILSLRTALGASTEEIEKLRSDLVKASGAMAELTAQNVALTESKRFRLAANLARPLDHLRGR